MKAIGLGSGQIQPKPIFYTNTSSEKDIWVVTHVCGLPQSLNIVTIKDNFLIRMVDELLNELHDSKIYSKLDLRLGYHWIRVKSLNIPQTAFCTQKGHHKFLVILFELTNALSTLQNLMNEIYKLYLRRFILVLFDDILVYNKIKMEHVKHLQVTLKY